MNFQLSMLIPARSSVTLVACLVCLLSPALSEDQIKEISQTQRLQGYYHDSSTTFFIFDPAVYGVAAPQRVVVTGAFRGWDQDMDDATWQLKKASGELWLLAVKNAQYQAIGPSSPFKFRVDDGRWLEPPAAAENRESGNLVFAAGVEPNRLRAEIRGPSAIWFSLSGQDLDRPLDVSKYRLTSADGKNVRLSAVIPSTANDAMLTPDSPIDPTRVYYMELPDLKLSTLCRRDGWMRNLYSSKTLGAEVSADGGETSFRLFAPRAASVRLHLYDAVSDKEAVKVVDMTRDPSGVWESIQQTNLDGSYYDFTVHGPADPGNFFYETHPVHISDPYARISVDSFGKCRVALRTQPARPLTGGRPKMEDVIAYEVHIQDFTDLLPVSDALKGTIPAMTQPGLKNSAGQSIGFDYLVDLGINVVHLMPVQEYLHYPDSEWQAAFKDDPFMIANGINLENYQWGYRTTHAFAIETRFRRRGTEHGAQREQFRDLVQAFHDRDIAVIIDLVPNHTGENMDGRHMLFNFNAIDLPYYYRTDDSLEHIGPFGNEVKTEDRPMTQRWLIDQCKHMIDEFGIDGFRIDLAGQIDKQTLLRLKHELGDDVVVYGEPWIAPSDPDVARHPDLGWYKKDAPITYFQDAARNAFKGPTSNPDNKATARGFAGGDGSAREDAMRGLLNSFDDEVIPNRGINYLDIHDNWTLADRFAKQNWDGRKGVDEGAFKIAAGLLFTSLGPIVLHGGTEIMRSKGAAKLEERVMSTASGKLHFHGKSDTYNQRVANRFIWENVGKAKRDGAACDYQGMHGWWKGMIAFRRSEAGAPFRLGTEPPAGYYRWVLPEDRRLLGYIVGDAILVLVNTSGNDAQFRDVRLPGGTWRLIADADNVEHIVGIDGDDAQLDGNAVYDLRVPATSLKIWIRQ